MTLPGDIRGYWRQVRQLQATLDEFVWLASHSSDPRVVVARVAAEMAARLILAGSHRQASPEEIEAHLAAEQAQERQARIEAKAREGAVTVVVE